MQQKEGPWDGGTASPPYLGLPECPPSSALHPVAQLRLRAPVRLLVAAPPARPMASKIALGRRIVADFHGQAAAGTDKMPGYQAIG